MAHTHQRHTLTAEAQDLTRTTTLHKREFAPAMTKRFRRLKGLLRTTVGYENDALELAAAQPRDHFTFDTRADAVDAFTEWLQEALDEDVLEQITPSRIAQGGHYTGPYLRTAYLRGLRGAERRLEEAGIHAGEASVGATFRMPVHQRTVQEIYTRAYDNLAGITDAIQETVRDDLATALTEGWNPRKAAARLTQDIDDIGITRARTLSRTEISNAYNTASARRYDGAGVDEVRILTSDPCPVCEALATNGPYPVSEADGLIPGRTHPNCVCCIAPVV
ncbi:hypothetical protein J2752_000445 [Halarchaeum rubridurum]|uniref:Phage head morphogenesis protein, SPP1 gp7 family n=1 Tax=Halarchaeum rubridurum TaxID=489911 RepID=A0A830FRF4_9EURY|nr:hypothetical protein [Halarchaeum rubridurum]MBP1953564.1 hypothetical protein [Halarchaeum rubridurum]GGM64357.1 hypothetical protein GCM10009017_12970 [Halarchaeum rubridurum]